MSHIVFIDANQYLGLCGLASGKKLLRLLEDQKQHIFIPKQVVNEVQRNKLGKFETFIDEELKKVQSNTPNVPDHLFGIDDTKLAEHRNTLEGVKKVGTSLREHANEVLKKISQSTGHTSVFLKGLFDHCIEATKEELDCARMRRERGNPPGYFRDSVGDQICWEQLLSHVRKDKSAHIWIISGDGDYLTKARKNVWLLNPFLTNELLEVGITHEQIHCYGNISDGLTAFGKAIDVSAEKLPDENEQKQIEKEIANFEANTAPSSVFSDILRDRQTTPVGRWFLDQQDQRLPVTFRNRFVRAIFDQPSAQPPWQPPSSNKPKADEPKDDENSS